MSIERRNSIQTDWSIPEVPAWAGSLTPGEFRTFLLAVDAVLTRAEMGPTVLQGAGLKFLGPFRRGAWCGLEPLARDCAMRPMDTWADRVERYLSHALRHLCPARDARPLTVDDMEDLPIRVQMVPGTGKLPWGGKGVTRKVAHDLCAMLVYDAGAVSVGVPRRHLGRNGLTVQRAFGSALYELGRAYHVEREVIEVPGGGPIEVIQGTNPFVSSRALGLGSLLYKRGHHSMDGVLVGVPDAQHLVYAPVNHRQVAETARAMLPMVHHWHRGSAAPVSAGLYWWQDGKFCAPPKDVQKVLGALDVPRPQVWIHAGN